MTSTKIFNDAALEIVMARFEAAFVVDNEEKIDPRHLADFVAAHARRAGLQTGKLELFYTSISGFPDEPPSLFGPLLTVGWASREIPDTWEFFLSPDWVDSQSYENVLVYDGSQPRCEVCLDRITQYEQDIALDMD